MEKSEAVATVRRWEAALNRGDREEVLRLSAPDVEIVGPRGTARVADVLRQWLEVTRVTLEPRRTFAGGATVVVVHGATWGAPETGEEMGRAEVASVFRLRRGVVAYYARHDSLDAALAGAGLTETDEVSS